MTESPEFVGITPYLHYEDILGAIEWLTRVFGFVEKGRWLDADGRVTNAELIAGATEIWLDGRPGWWQAQGRRPDTWIGVWVSDVDAMGTRIVQAGIEAGPPQHKFYGVRMLQVADPEGITWGFMQRAPFVAGHPADSPA
jgi:uncharacterized glyoxalase superfamily protein PhnB